MYEFEIYVSHDGYIAGHIPEVVKTFKGKDVRKAFNKANKWIRKEYEDKDSPSYCIISEFGIVHII